MLKLMLSASLPKRHRHIATHHRLELFRNSRDKINIFRVELLAQHFSPFVTLPADDISDSLSVTIFLRGAHEDRL